MLAFAYENESDLLVSVNSDAEPIELSITDLCSQFMTPWVILLDDDSVPSLCIDADPSTVIVLRRANESTYEPDKDEFVGPTPRRRPW